MKKIAGHINNRRGSVMALALMIMVTLTIVGLMAMQDTIIENTVARNHALYRTTLYAAEATVREAAQVMEDLSENDPQKLLDPSEFDWLHQKKPAFNLGDIDFTNQVDFRGDDGSVEHGPFAASNLSTVDDAGYLVQFEGIAPGASLDMTDPTNLYFYCIFGRAVGPMKNDASQAIIKVGYRMRY